tara:strand:- start:2797 stop:3393 length:597 start_codon:yes stop_codon:yes gene_type:complete
MEEINKELDSKSIERTEIKEVVEEVKPKKTRTEAQKQAFEKARKKREANLKARKEEAELDSWAEEELQREDPQPVIKAPPKRRGRPRKKKEEPPAPQFIPPPDPQLTRGIPIQGQIPMNPYQQFQYYQPPPTPAPVNNYYYYGAPPPKEEPTPDSFTKHPVFEPPVEPEVTFEEPPQEEEVEYETYASTDPRLKFRFA